MRRLTNPEVDIPGIFQLLNLAEHSLGIVLESLPYLGDEQLVEAFAYAASFGKRSWIIQAAILYEAQQRSIHGEGTLEAIARRFEMTLRQAQKYALVWKVFFADKGGEEKNVNIDVFEALLLDEPSWYVVAVTETKEPEQWLEYAQDRKVADARYSVAAFRRDIQYARFYKGVGDLIEERYQPAESTKTHPWECPWVRLVCTRSGKPMPYGDCQCQVRPEEEDIAELVEVGNE